MLTVTEYFVIYIYYSVRNYVFIKENYKIGTMKILTHSYTKDMTYNAEMKRNLKIALYGGNTISRRTEHWDALNVSFKNVIAFLLHSSLN